MVLTPSSTAAEKVAGWTSVIPAVTMSTSDFFSPNIRTRNSFKRKLDGVILSSRNATLDPGVFILRFSYSDLAPSELLFKEGK